MQYEDECRNGVCMNTIHPHFFFFFFFAVDYGYTVKHNASFHFTNILSNTKINSNVLHFTVYLNNSLYQTLESLTLHLKDHDVFTSYFNLSSRSAIEIIFFNTSNPENASDQLIVTRSIVYASEAPIGVYQAELIATVRGRTLNGINPSENMDNATIVIAVTQSMLYDLNSLD